MKELIQQKPYLIWLLAGLLFAQFVVVPVMTWQDEKVAQLALVQKRLGKALHLLNNEQSLDEQQQFLQAARTQYQGLFFAQAEETSFQLKNQKMIEALAEKYQLTVNSIGWKKVSNITDSQLSTYELQMRFTSKTKDIIPFQIAIEQLPQLVKVEGMNINIKRHLKNTMGRANGLFRLHLTMVSNENYEAGVNTAVQQGVNAS